VLPIDCGRSALHLLARLPDRLRAVAAGVHRAGMAHQLNDEAPDRLQPLTGEPGVQTPR
jgi:hypothetical protein